MEQPRQRVNASMLASHHGKVVCLLGLAHSVESNGMSFQMNASDKEDVTVKMQEPLQEYVDGLVEVHGKVEPTNEVTCYNYVAFNAETAKQFDMASYNRAIELTVQIPEHYIQGVQT